MPEREDPAIALEAARIVDEYDRRSREIPADVYEPTAAENLWRLQQRMRWAVAFLRKADLLPLASRRLLDVGCGDGLWLAEWGVLGARHEHMSGVDLIEARLEKARERFGRPQTTAGGAFHGPDFRLHDATHLPWPDESFDIVMQSTVFSSILSEQAQTMVASEMIRVLAPGGAVLWYDFRVSNPRNPNVRGISSAKLRQLFPRCAIQSRAICVAPPLARWLVPRSWLAATLLEASRVTNTSLIATIRRPSR